jgi:sulfur carrier protein ThiS
MISSRGFKNRDGDEGAMEQLIEVNATGTLKTYRAPTERTVAEVLRALHLEAQFFAVLVNGKRVGLGDIVEQDAEITILPKIAGGGVFFQNHF